MLAQIRDALVKKARAQAGKDAPKHLAVDSQSVPSTAKGGARGYDGGKKIKGRKRHIVVDSQGSVLGVWVSPAEVSDARGARVVLEQVLRRYPSAQIVIADGAYDKEGLLEWLLGEFCVALDCVFREGQGIVVLERRWLVERSFAWLLGVVGCRVVMTGCARWRRVG